MDDSIVIGAFGEDEAARLSGLSTGQLKQWDRSGFLRASFSSEEKNLPHNRIYSFRDIVSLRVLGQLRNTLKVPMQELRRVALELAEFGDAKWTATVLYVLGKRVVFTDPRTSERREVVTGQRVLDIPLRVAISDTKRAISHLNDRPSNKTSQVVQAKFVQQNEPVISGTRIPVAAIIRYIDAGFSPESILKEYPSLTEADIDAAVNFGTGKSAA